LNKAIYNNPNKKTMTGISSPGDANHYKALLVPGRRCKI